MSGSLLRKPNMDRHRVLVIADMVRCAVQFSVSAIVAVLLAALCLAAFPQFGTFNFASASSTLAVGDVEYANGTITIEHSPLLVWFDWVNVSGTQVINYILYTKSDYPYPVPIANLLGQHFRLEDGTEVFVASALSKFEVYSDMNSDGIPQANFTSGDSEILYYMYMNMSDSYSIIPIQKVMENSVPHYRWGFTYENAYAYFQNSTARVGIVAKLIFDHITLTYDFSVNGNVSNLKTNFDIGKVVSLEVLDSSQFSLDGLSLALLYATSTYAAKPYSTYVNSQPYNSTTTEDSAINAEIAQVAVENTKAYDFVFGGNYTLNRDANNETHEVVIETYEVKAEAAALSSLPITLYQPVVWQPSFFSDLLNLTDLFGGSLSEFNMDYDKSWLIYRICFPVWDGMHVQHDPVYVGYLFSSTVIPEIPTAIILPIFIIAVSLILVMAKRRKYNSIKN
jgi:hypothetical protein